MKRRIAIKNLSLAFGGLISLPSWATNGWNSATVQLAKPLFSDSQERILTSIVEAILPESDTMGAKSVGVPSFIQRMVADCYDKDFQASFKANLEAVDKLAQNSYAKAFTEAELSQKQELLLKLEKGEDVKLKEFYAFVKNLTIQGYTTSEYVMTTFLNYNMAPGHYYGCVPVKTT